MFPPAGSFKRLCDRSAIGERAKAKPKQPLRRRLCAFPVPMIAERPPVRIAFVFQRQDLRRGVCRPSTAAVCQQQADRIEPNESRSSAELTGFHARHAMLQVAPPELRLHLRRVHAAMPLLFNKRLFLFPFLLFLALFQLPMDII